MKVYRDKIRNSLEDQILLQTDLKISTDDSKDIIDELEKGELIVAVVGEVNRGKSTFLNALMGSEVFPSRATVCTAGVTVLDNADVPKAQIVYNNGKTEEIQINSENPALVLSEHISRKNTNVRDISSLNIKYPNQFSGNGILIVDTPGVNDPDNWREEITYNYLGAADAVIMLLDPMKPLSASETEFLKDKILNHSISKLIFIANKIDHIPMNDRQGIEDRLNKILSDYVPNPDIHLVSSKQALEGKIQQNDNLLLSSGFNHFEDYLLQFLMKGRGGALLETKIKKGLVIVDNIQQNIENRLGALDNEKGVVKEKLNNAVKELKNIDKRKQKLEKDIKNEESKVVSELKQTMQSHKNLFLETIKKDIIDEPDLPRLRTKVLGFQKQTVKVFSDKITFSNERLSDKYKTDSIEVIKSVKDLLSGLNKQAASSAGSLSVNKTEELLPEEAISGDVKSGGAVGGIVGGTVGTIAAANATWVAAGSLWAFTTFGVAVMGALTGGLGLLAGAGIASLIKKNKEKNTQSSYIEKRDIVDNTKAVSAVDNFLSGMEKQSKPIGRMIIRSFLDRAIVPIDKSINDQKTLIKNIEGDLGKTDADQQSLRTNLSGSSERTSKLRDQYNKIVSEIRSV